MFAVEGLRKAFGGAEALKGVNLAIEPGEVHALLGPNGAGKSTLIKCLGGAISADEGTIVLGDERFASLTPRQSRESGVAVIYQHFSLIPSLTVADNMFLGDEKCSSVFVRRREQETEAADLLREFQQDIAPTTLVGDLPIASQQLIEIAKALRREPKLLILDEPTASLTEVEAKLLADLLRHLKSTGVPILYVTHLLEEVFDVADHVTVLRDGAVVLSSDVKAVTRRELVNAIAGEGRVSEDGVAAGDFAGAADSTALELRSFTALGIGPLDLHIRHGEVVGIFGLLGSGRTELLEAVFGVRPVEEGEILLDSEPAHFDGPHDAIAGGVALVPGERLKLSLFLPLSSLENMLLPSFDVLAKSGLRRQKAERTAFDRVAKFLELRPPDAGIPVRQLSGGNQQKVAVGRWLTGHTDESGRVRLLMLDEPTQGIDVGARSDLYRILREFVAGGQRSVVMTSSDPDEMLAVVDRAYVLHRGRVVAELSRAEISAQTLLTLAHGTIEEEG